ncbi:hypothetical protein [Pendulispora albinea]|uniref:Uncharacterized protein n=1 Tax=Pendulispora albinea TaxID=2741071 RepID=A0ABZ2LM84_9BACT
MKRLYIRCNGGHYFLAGAGCPFDGWTMTGVASAAAYFMVLLHRRGEISLEAMKEALPSDELLKRMLIIDFGDENAIFEALAPELYLYHGKTLHADDVDLNLL